MASRGGVGSLVKENGRSGALGDEAEGHREAQVVILFFAPFSLVYEEGKAGRRHLECAAAFVCSLFLRLKSFAKRTCAWETDKKHNKKQLNCAEGREKKAINNQTARIS